MILCSSLAKTSDASVSFTLIACASAIVKISGSTKGNKVLGYVVALFNWVSVVNPKDDQDKIDAK